MQASKTLLVVDDSKLSRMMIKAHVLDFHPGWKLLEAANAEQTLDLVKKTNIPDLITLDVNMPGMDGLELVGHIRETWPSVPIVVISANIQDSIKRRCDELQVGFVGKPVTAESIRLALAFLN